MAIGGGILFIVISDPPRTVCFSQTDYLQEQQQGFLFSDPKAPESRKPSFTRMFEYCEKNNGPGGCYEFFSKMRLLSQDLQSVPDECTGRAGGFQEIENALWKTMNLMVRAAWGSVPPKSYPEKFGWLDAADIALYCSLKTQLIRLYGNSTWENYREKLFHELPGAKDLPRKDTWEKILLSEECRKYQ